MWLRKGDLKFCKTRVKAFMQNDWDFEDIILLYRTCFGAGLEAVVKKYLFLSYE